MGFFSILSEALRRGGSQRADPASWSTSGVLGGCSGGTGHLEFKPRPTSVTLHIKNKQQFSHDIYLYNQVQDHVHMPQCVGRGMRTQLLRIDSLLHGVCSGDRTLAVRSEGKHLPSDTETSCQLPHSA